MLEFRRFKISVQDAQIALFVCPLFSYSFTSFMYYCPYSDLATRFFESIKKKLHQRCIDASQINTKQRPTGKFVEMVF
jgi:hypothetical protein